MNLKKPSLLIARNIFITLFFSPVMHLLLVIYTVITIAYLNSQIQMINSETLVIMTDPYQIPMIIMVISSGLFLAFSTLLSIARERENGTMETLFYAPIRTRDYLIGYSIGHLLIFCYMLIFTSIMNYLLSAISFLQLSERTLLFSIFSIPVIICCIGLGELLACFTRNVKTAVILFLIVFVFLTSIQIGTTVLSSVVTEKGLTDLVFLRDMMAFINQVFSYVNPVTCFLRITDAILGKDWIVMIKNLIALVSFAVIAMVSSDLLLKKKGVLCE